jgi:hypothetical protein
MARHVTYAEWMAYLWNRSVPVGSDVEVMLDDCSIRHTKTRSEAWVAHGYEPLVKVEGISGGYSLVLVMLPGEGG